MGTGQGNYRYEANLISNDLIIALFKREARLMCPHERVAQRANEQSAYIIVHGWLLQLAPEYTVCRKPEVASAPDVMPCRAV